MKKLYAQLKLKIMTSALLKEMLMFVGIYVALFSVFVIFIKIRERQQAEKSKTEFAYMVCHQLLSPLTNIRLLIELLSTNKSYALSGKQAAMVEKIEKNNFNMIKLVNILLKISKLESGKLEIFPTLTDLSEIVRQITDEYQLLLKKKNMKIVFNTYGKLPKIIVDPDLMKEVYNNLINNAIKFSKTGGTINVTHRLVNNRFLITVEDHGCGINKKDQKKLFEKFSSGIAIKSEQRGTGLGLYFTKLVIQAFHGTISCKSVEGKATLFLICLPLS